MKPNFTSYSLTVFLLMAMQATVAQTINLSKTVDNITTSASGTLAAQNHELQYTINVTNLSPVNITVAKLFDNVPAGSAYIPGSTFLNGTAVADVGGTMPF